MAVVLMTWELAAWASQSPSFPGFVTVLLTALREWRELATQMWITLQRAAMGFGLALLSMIPLGIFIGRTPRFAPFVEPLIDMLRPLPPLAIVPLAMLFFGIGGAAKVSVIFYGAAFPLLLNTIDATRATHPLLVNVGRSIGLSRSEIMLQIDLPAALPQIMAGVRQSVAMALLISVSAEMLLSSDGVGNYLMRAQEQFQIAAGMACIVVVALTSLLINELVRRVERKLLGWHHQRQGISGS